MRFNFPSFILYPTTMILNILCLRICEISHSQKGGWNYSNSLLKGRFDHYFETQKHNFEL